MARLAELANFDFIFSADIGSGVCDAYQNEDVARTRAELIHSLTPIKGGK
jgi:hypothetical protein